MKKIINNIRNIGVIVLFGATPNVSFAQAPANDVRSLINFLAGLFQRTLIPMMVSLGLIYLIIAVIQYIGANEDSAKRKEKKQQIFWAIIGLFVILSIWSLVAIVQNSFRIFGGGTLR